MGSLHSFEPSPPRHGLTVLCKTYCTAMVAGQGDLCHTHSTGSSKTFICMFCSEEHLQYALAVFQSNKNNKARLFHSEESRGKHHSRVLPVFLGTCRNKEMVHCLLLHKHQSVFDSVSAASSSLSKKRLYHLKHEKDVRILLMTNDFML